MVCSLVCIQKKVNKQLRLTLRMTLFGAKYFVKIADVLLVTMLSFARSFPAHDFQC